MKILGGLIVGVVGGMVLGGMGYETAAGGLFLVALIAGFVWQVNG